MGAVGVRLLHSKSYEANDAILFIFVAGILTLIEQIRTSVKFSSLLGCFHVF